MIVRYDVNLSFLVQATVNVIVNCNHNAFKVQATGKQRQLYFFNFKSNIWF